MNTRMPCEQMTRVHTLMKPIKPASKRRQRRQEINKQCKKYQECILLCKQEGKQATAGMLAGKKNTYYNQQKGSKQGSNLESKKVRKQFATILASKKESDQAKTNKANTKKQ